jgi:DNA-binding NarL/FixJ family response regulator
MSPDSARNITVALIEDDAGIRETMSAFLRQAPGFELRAVYPSAERALEALQQSVPEVVLMDINLPGMSGIEATSALKKRHPEARIVMLTVYEDGDALFNSLRAGACGYVLKRTRPERILEAIRDARDGGVPLNPQMAAQVAGYFQQQSLARSDVESLSPRERQVLGLLAEGLLYKQIAARLELTTKTINEYVKSIYKKLHVHSRTEAVVKFLHH